MLDKLKMVTGSAEDTLLSYLLELTKDRFKAYCCRDDVPEEATNIIVELAAAAYKKQTNDGAVSSVSEGDSSVSFADVVTTVFDSYERVLQRWRKLRTI